MRRSAALALASALVFPGLAASGAAEPTPLAGVRRVVFLGDSITYSGQYVEYVEAYLQARTTRRSAANSLTSACRARRSRASPSRATPAAASPAPTCTSGSTASWQRPKPDLVVACYGMNDGIYYPFSEDRFEKYRDGITLLREKAAAAGAEGAPPHAAGLRPVARSGRRPCRPGLPSTGQPYEGYDEVLDHYSAWLLGRRADGWDVVDVHGPMAGSSPRERGHDPDYRLAGDGVHVNEIGHWIIAREILVHWGVPDRTLNGKTSAEAFAAFPQGAEVLKLVQQRQRLLRDAWLTETGHKRPGMRPGLPLAEAERRAQEIGAKIQGWLVPPAP